MTTMDSLMPVGAAIRVLRPPIPVRLVVEATFGRDPDYSLPFAGVDELEFRWLLALNPTFSELDKRDLLEMAPLMPMLVGELTRFLRLDALPVCERLVKQWLVFASSLGPSVPLGVQQECELFLRYYDAIVREVTAAEPLVSLLRCGLAERHAQLLRKLTDVAQMLTDGAVNVPL